MRYLRTKRRRGRAVISALVVAAVAATAIGSTAEAAAPAAKKVDPNAEFRFAINYTYSSLDPIKSNSSDPWLTPLYDTLVAAGYVDGELTLLPKLAKSWKVSADGLSISFVLRDDVTFQDGTEFDANAVKANIEARLAQPATAAAALLVSVASVEVVDPTHAVVHLKNPDPSVLWVLEYANAGSMISPTALRNGTDLTKTAAGSGPFELVSTQQNGVHVLDRWDGYWDKGAVLVKRLTISTIPDVNARYNGLRSGQYDAVNMSGLDYEASQDKDNRYLFTSNNSYGVYLNSDLPPFDDVRVRRAVSMALDREAIAETILDGLSKPVYQDFMPGGLGYDPALDKDPYNPKKAAKLVKKAGADGVTVNCDNHNSTKTSAMGVYVQQALADIGIKVELTPFTAAQARTEWRKGAFPCYIDGMANNRPDPAQTLEQVYLAVDNPAKTKPAELVSMAAKAKALPYGSQQREDAYIEINRWLHDNPVHVPFAETVYTYLAAKNVVGAKNMVVKTTAITQLDFRNVGIAKRS